MPNLVVFPSLSHVQLFVIPQSAGHQASLSITNSWSLLKLVSIESVMSFNHLILCHTLLLLPSIFPSIRVFSIESALRIWWPKFWSFSFSISPSNEYSGLISFSIDWLDLFVVQGTLKSLIQHHGSKPSIVHYSPFFMLQMSYPYMTSGNIIALIILNFFSIVTTLLLKMLHDLLSFLQTSKHHLISWLQSSSAVILEPPKIKSHCFNCFPIYLP